MATISRHLPEPPIDPGIPGFFRLDEWSVGELNPRPRQCHCRALPTELTPHFNPLLLP